MSRAGAHEIRRGFVAKRANYGFEKRQKELKRQQKKDAKAEKKRMKKESGAGDDPLTVESDAQSAADQQRDQAG
jgi:hypothetical protein